MLKNLFCVILCFSIVNIASGQNIVHDENAQVRNVGNFHSIHVQGGITVYLSQGSNSGVAVSTTEEKNLDKIITEVRNGVLTLKLETGVWNTFNFGNKKIKAYVTVNQLQKLELDGGSILKSADPIKITSLNGEVNGGSILDINVTGTDLKMEVSGGSIAEVKGTVKSIDVELNGGSILKASYLKSDAVTLEANGGSVATAKADKQINIEANGGSVVNYSGDAAEKNIQSNGGSVVKRKS